ncbi:hypothetical protein [Noviherbaspirillum massiliense]|uniref:hypothetical protein n=1 Tax=Noviherbaspirillum massiliense TaxID=1465823 RepID=UPI000302BA73|nr:hypothetical protein [Noviherbaspirillum massiliense]
MSLELMSSPAVIAALVLGILGAILMFWGLFALLRFRPRWSIRRILGGMLMLGIAVLGCTMALALHGYQALTREEVAVRLSVRPLEAQRFEARMRFADGREAVYQLAGDEVYVDARILKWHPYANMLGLHTVYELDRVGGRYHAIEQERAAQRTVYPLGQEKLVDLFGLRRRHEFLKPLVDAQYGSATFLPVSGPAEFEVRVSTTGLLMRQAESTPM